MVSFTYTMKTPSWTVTRQHQWPDGLYAVEVSAGGRDYTNPGALSKKYSGEFETYRDPREAVEVAIRICRDWRKDGEPKAKVGHGATGGMSMYFHASTYKDLRSWAQATWEKLDKCVQCGDVLVERWGPPWGHQSEYDCCSERCVDKHYEL